jgi:hypothetical protein
MLKMVFPNFTCRVRAMRFYSPVSDYATHQRLWTWLVLLLETSTHYFYFINRFQKIVDPELFVFPQNYR